MRWEEMAAQPKYDEISESIDAGLDNLAKWYRTTDDSDTYILHCSRVCNALLITNQQSLTRI